MRSIARARRAFMKTASFADSEAITGINRKTLRTWALRYGWLHQRAEKVNPKPNPPEPQKPQGQWMQSLHHSDAHFIFNGEAACSANSNGAKVTAGSRWFQLARIPSGVCNPLNSLMMFISTSRWNHWLKLPVELLLYASLFSAFLSCAV